MRSPWIRRLGQVPYAETLAEMLRFTESRSADTPDEIWFLEHPPVFTLGLNADRSHVLAPGEIPVVAADRGGQVTYHGPGQLVAYLLVDLRRAGLNIRDIVSAMEGSVIGTLGHFGVQATSHSEAPGVYVGSAKIASVGLRIKRGCSYHGLALNVRMDLEPFSRINPCGYSGLAVTQLADLGGPADPAVVASALEPRLIAALGLS
jgi:lipoyl(octanoyl) transferase